VDPKGRAASATFNAPKTKLVPPSDRGFMRNDDDGGWHDSQEWVFVDLRTANAMRTPGALGALFGLIALAAAGRVRRLHGILSSMLCWHNVTRQRRSIRVQLERELPQLGPSGHRSRAAQPRLDWASPRRQSPLRRAGCRSGRELPADQRREPLPDGGPCC
jgi:hypothetical protein